MADIWTSPEEIREAICLARAETRQVVRRDAERLPDQAERFRTLEENLFERDFGVLEVRELGGKKFRRVFEMTPGHYLAARRVRTVERILELVKYGMPIGRAAMAGGLFTYGTCRRAFINVNDELPVVICRPVCLGLRFDELTWHRARHGELSQDDVAALLLRLRRLYPGLLDGRLPAALALPPGRRGKRLPRPGGISDDEARMAVELASAAACRRILAAAEGLQQQSVVTVLEVVAADLLDKELKGKTCRERAKIGDTSISAKVQFFLGDTLPEAIERGRIEASLALVVDRRFTLDDVAQRLGFCKRAFTDAFRRRTGAYPQEVRNTAAADSHLAAYRLWLAAEGGKLAPGKDARRLSRLLSRLIV